MIAFDKELLQNTLLIEAADDLKSGEFLSDEQFRAAKAAFPALKTHRNLFLRIAFLLLGSFCYASCSGVAALVLLSSGDGSYELMAILMAILGIVSAEVLSRNSFYAHGLDDAAILGFLLWIGIASAAISESSIAVSVAVALAAVFCTMRYSHTLSAIIGVMALVAFIGILAFEYHVIPEFYLTFVLFFASIALFFAYRKLRLHTAAAFYSAPLQALQLCSLLIAYFSMNYLVVREMARDFMDYEVGPGADIPMAYLFYFTTFAIPVSYIVFGVRLRSKIMLWCGLFALGFSIFTIRFYYHVIPTEWALVLGGSALLGFALLAARKLKHRQRGLTFEKDRMHDSRALSVAQAVIVNSHAIQDIPSNGPMEFGGGGFSGGGAGGSF